MSKEKLIEIKNLKTFFTTDAGIARAVNDVSFDNGDNREKENQYQEY